MKVVFRVDASLQMGTGHVMRCLTLAQMLKENNVSVEFICRKHEGSLIDKIHSSGFNVHELEVLAGFEVDNKLAYSHWLGATQNQDADECIDILKKEKIDWLIVDHYAIDEDWQCKLRPYYEKLMVVDDLADRKHQCDMLLDQTFGRQQGDYSALTPEGCELLLGSKYALLRPEFAKWRAYSLERRSKPEFKQLLINMGGIDVDNVTESVLGELITIVMGASAPHLESVKSKANTLPHKIEVVVNADNMAEIMVNADIAIGAAGSTTWERCCLGLPAIQIVVAKNQSLIAELLARKNAIQYLQDISQLPTMLNNAESWIKNIGNVTAQICDGIGACRVFNKITDYKIFLECFGEVELCNYVNLNIDEKILVLNMRNHPQIKKWMSNQDDILEISHFNFIKNLENIVDQRYFLVKQHKSIVGSINFSKVGLSSSVEFGIYTNPFVHLKGAGSILEAVASYYAFIELGVNKIKLEVFSNNEKAIGFYKKCGFELIKTKKVNHKDRFCMEKIRTLEEAQ